MSAEPHSRGQWVIRQVHTPAKGESPEAVWEFDFAGIRDDPEALVEVFRATVVETSGIADCYITSTRKSTYEWGSSGSSWDVLITAAVGLFSAGAYDLLKQAALTLSTRWDAESLNREDAIARAKYRLALRYPDVATSDLVLVSETSNGSDTVWTLDLESATHRFSVTLESLEGLRTTRIQRTAK